MHVIPQPRIVDRWTEKRVAFGVYDNIGILGEYVSELTKYIHSTWLLSAEVSVNLS